MILIAICIFALVCSTQSRRTDWTAYKAEYNKSYPNPQEDLSRKMNFMNSLKYINKYNSEGNSAILGINEFSDWSDSEKKSLCGGILKEFTKEELQAQANMTNVKTLTLKDSDYKNWAEEGVVSPVKNQGRCGSCWAFGSVVAFEAANYFKTKELTQYSEQQLLDCTESGSCGRGGNIFEAVNVANKQGGVASSDCYAKYSGRQNKCSKSKCDNKLEISEENLVVKDELSDDEIASLLNDNGPLYFLMAIKKPFYDYKRNIFYCNDNDEDRGNHIMAIVGYGSEEEKPYWIVKNSWGTKWGEKGYVKLPRGHEARCNQFHQIAYIKLD